MSEMTPEEEINALKKEAHILRRSREELEGDFRRLRLVEEELRGIIADRESIESHLKREAERNRKWEAHADMLNDCNRRSADALENIADLLLQKLS